MKYNTFIASNSDAIEEQFHINSLLSKVIEYNHLDQEKINDFLSQRIIYHDFSLFEDADMTLDRILEAIEMKEKIVIYGDYDCDGIMATTILVQAFKELGVDVGYHIPNRFEDGYGLNTKRVEQMAKKGYSLIITVDNGITCFEAIDRANELGIDVIVTDHHALKEELPDACTIIHTKVSPDYPFKEICGGFVAYKLAAALLERQDKYLYTLASISTLSDMMPLVDENRSIVIKGLSFMNQEHYLPLELLVGKNKNYTTTTVNFNIVPKINSLGRMPEYLNPNVLVKYFLKDTPKEYQMQVATMCNDINETRKKLANDTYNYIMNDYEESFLYYGDDTIHEGILGLVAGKYTSRYGYPAFVMHYEKTTETYKGSARSVQGFSIQSLYNEYSELFEVCGGHDLAGGFTITKDNFIPLKQAISNKLEQSDLSPSINTLLVDDIDITIENIESLSLLEPFGMCNEEPVFELRNIKIEGYTLLSEGKHLKMKCSVHTLNFDALFFNVGSRFDAIDFSQIHTFVGSLQVNEFRNVKNINFIIKDIQ